MNTYWINFEGSIEINADNEEDAKKNFFNWIINNVNDIKIPQIIDMREEK